METDLLGWVRRHRIALIATGAYAILALVMTWPLVKHLNTQVAGPGDDLLVHYWNGWWAKRVLSQGGDLFHTDLLFYPTGVSLLYHNISWYNIALWLPLQPLVGGVAAFNLVYLSNLVLCAIGMYALARYLTRSTAAAFVAGLVYAFWPYRLFEIDHPNLIATQWLPLYVLQVMRTVRGQRKVRHAILAALFLAFTGYVRWQLVILALIVTIAYLFYSLASERSFWSWRVVAALAVLVTVSLALWAPVLFPMVRGQLTRAHPEDLYTPIPIPKHTDLLAYFVPPHDHILEGLFRGLEYAKSYSRPWYSNVYLGYFVMLLVVLGAFRAGRARWFWMAVAFVAWVLALGSSPRLNKHIYEHIRLPHYWLRDFLPIRIMREERRFAMLLALPIAAMAAHGVELLQDRVRSWARIPARCAPILFAGLTALVCLDYLQIPLEVFDTEVSPYFETLAEETGDFGILNLPTGRDRSPFFMLCQTTHTKPIVEGSVARPPREASVFVEENPFLLYLRENRSMNPDLPDVSRQLAILAGTGVRYLIIHEPYAFPWEKDNWRTYLAYEPMYDDSFVSVYRTLPEAGRDYELARELHDGIGLTSVISSSDGIAPRQLMEVAVVWGTTKAQDEDFQVELALVDDLGQLQQRARFAPVADWPTSEWPKDALGHGRYAFEVDAWLPSGSYALTLSLVKQGTGERVGEAVVVADGLKPPIDPRVFEPPAMQTTVEAAFGRDVRLLGYDLDQEGGEYSITLHWQALRRMVTSYKQFVHLYDDSGEVVAQADVVPRGWTYPTSWWEAGEVVSDEVKLLVGDVGPGRYRLAVGVYDPETGARLSISSEGLAELSDALILEEVALP